MCLEKLPLFVSFSQLFREPRVFGAEVTSEYSRSLANTGSYVALSCAQKVGQLIKSNRIKKEKSCKAPLLIFQTEEKLLIEWES